MTKDEFIKTKVLSEAIKLGMENHDLSKSKYELEVEKLLRNGNLVHLLSGLSAETGEVCSLFQKAAYKGNLQINRNDLKLELGDVLFYVTAIANMFEFSLKEIQDANIEKLTARLNDRY